MTEKVLLKDLLFSPQKVQKIASELQAVYPTFNATQFEKDILQAFPNLELKERITCITTQLKTYLPARFEDAVDILLKALPNPCDPTLSDNDFGDFIYAPYSQYLATYGCTAKQLSLSLNALEEITTRFSAEDAIRFFINAFPQQTLAKLKTWTHHPHYHVRRLVTEGTRPKLPWAQKITYDPDMYLPLLDALCQDPTRYVTRSIANHLNDVSKFNPSIVFQTLKKWQQTQKINPKEWTFMVRHSLRTLIKQGHPEALHWLGFPSKTEAQATLTLNPNQLKIGETLQLSLHLSSPKIDKILLDYAITFVTKNKKPSQKVFKWTTLTLSKNQPQTVEKTYTFKKNMTTRTFYPGTHRVDILINGNTHLSEEFELYE